MRALKTPRAEMAIAARGNGQRRTRKLPSPHAAFYASAKGLRIRRVSRSHFSSRGCRNDTRRAVSRLQVQRVVRLAAIGNIGT